MLRKRWPSCRENQVRRIPVVNQEGILEGMVATADILQRANVSDESVFKKTASRRIRQAASQADAEGRVRQQQPVSKVQAMENSEGPDFGSGVDVRSLSDGATLQGKFGGEDVIVARRKLAFKY